MTVSLACEPLRVWSRLEGRARQADFSRNLAAEIYDPLWMLARQWQFGEFKGEDTGSPITAKLALRSARLDGLRARGEAGFGAIDDGVPLETQATALSVDLDVQARARWGQQWQAIIDAAGAAFNAGGGAPAYDATASAARYRRLFPIALPDLSGDTTVARVARARDAANPRAARTLRALAGRAPDGAALLAAIPPGALNWAGLPSSLRDGVPDAHQDLLLASLERFRVIAASIPRPPEAGPPTWSDAQLEYQFDCRVPRPDRQALLLGVDAFDGSRLDWYDFDLGELAAGSDVGTGTTTETSFTVIPSRAEFSGQPNPRWWQMEDGAVDLGNIRADTTDLARIVVAEFALVYGNNWFVIPCRQDVGTLAEVLGVVVSDVFGQRTFVESADHGDGSTWTRWDFFSLGRPRTASSPSPLGAHLLLPPTLAEVQQGEPLESVRLVRDEMTNMVWAVESRVADGVGGGRDGFEAARRFTDALLPPPATGPSSGLVPGLAYELANAVPENWIPFVPVHRPLDDRAVRLQRASMPRFAADTVRPVRPQTAVLRPGLTVDDQQAAPYFIHEEEVTRVGVQIDAGFRRARGSGGEIVCWYARQTRAGRGEGGSGLRYDRLLDVPVPAPTPVRAPPPSFEGKSVLDAREAQA
jgi:hypothetical protein